MSKKDSNKQSRSQQEQTKEHFPEMHILHAVKQRCFNKNDRAYRNYGGRGITICKRYLENLRSFILDIGHRPSLKYSLGRIDNDGNYSCGKCSECIEKSWTLNIRWETRTQQNRNTRRNRFETFQGQTKTVAEWAEIYNMPYGTVVTRLNHYKWTLEKALTIPVLNKGVVRNEYTTTKVSSLLTYNGITKPVAIWAKELGIDRTTLLGRLERGWTLEEALTTPRKESFVRYKN